MQYNFDRVSSQYDETRHLPDRVSGRITQWVLSRLPADPAITEIGVGSGRIAIPFIKRGVRYTGLDISAQMLQRAHDKLNGQLQRAVLIHADVTEPLPLAEGSQDAVIAVHILHLIDAVKALHEVRRILKPHGALIWGYQQHGELSVRARLRERLRSDAAELGHANRDFKVPQARALLSDWGAAVSRHAVAAWTTAATPRQVLDGLASRTHSFTWSISDDLFASALQLTENWARSEYGDLDRPHEEEEQFMVDWYQF